MKPLAELDDLQAAIEESLDWIREARGFAEMLNELSKKSADSYTEDVMEYCNECISEAEVLWYPLQVPTSADPSAFDAPPPDMEAYQAQVDAMVESSRLYTPPKSERANISSDYDDSPFDVDWKHK